MDAYAALSKTPHALADDLMLVFQHAVKNLQNAFWLGNPAPLESDMISSREAK
jgi:hypothetical protein